MEIQSMLPGYLDVIFSGRNKAYGGYELRSNYSHRARNGALYAFLGAGLVLAVLMIPARGTHISPTVPLDFGSHMTDLRPVPIPKQPILEPHAGKAAQATAPAAQVHTNTLTTPVIVANTMVDDAKLLATVADMHNAQPAIVAGTGADVPTGSVSGNGNVGIGTGVGTGTGITNDDKPFGIVDQMPEFNGDINSYMNTNLRYPEAARAGNIAGRVVVRFVVNEDGSISGAEVVKGIGGGCNEEAIRVINHMPKWKAGKQNSHAVKVYFMMPISFVLQ